MLEETNSITGARAKTEIDSILAWQAFRGDQQA
jgi:hypothetical protein